MDYQFSDEGDEKPLRAQVSRDNPLLAPYSGVPCVYYEAVLAHQAGGGSYFIARERSDADFHVHIGGKLVVPDRIEMDFMPQFTQTFIIEQIPERIIKHWDEKGYLSSVGAHPSVTVRETVLVAGQEYRLLIMRQGGHIPPEEPGGESRIVTSDLFSFSNQVQQEDK